MPPASPIASAASERGKGGARPAPGSQGASQTKGCYRLLLPALRPIWRASLYAPSWQGHQFGVRLRLGDVGRPVPPTPDGALFVGSPQTVATKIVKTARELGLSRFDLKYSLGTLPHEQLMSSIRLYGAEVAPLVRAQLGATEPIAAAGRP